MNKKGEAILSDILGFTITMVIILIFLAMSFSIRKDIVKQTINQASATELNTDLIIFLKQYEIINKKEFTIAEHIIQAEFNETLRELLGDKIENHFNKYEDNAWRFIVEYPNGDLIEERRRQEKESENKITGNYMGRKAKETTIEDVVSIVIIPSLNGKDINIRYSTFVKEWTS